MFSTAIFLTLLIAGHARASLNGTCSVQGTPGVCISTASCASAGGTSSSGLCPDDPAHIQCCTKPTCGSGGNCRFEHACSSRITAADLCPGPTDFNCCLPETGSDSGDNDRSCGIPNVNQATVNLIKEFEGFVASPAPDPVGYPTVGYGHRCRQRNCAEVPYPFPLSHQTASALLHSDLKMFTKCVSQDIRTNVRLNEYQFGALVSWAFNMGCGSVQGSALVRRLNNRENLNVVVEQELPKWNKAGGHVLPGLTSRRASEVRFFKKPSRVIVHPTAC